jgi:AcrR family transcriptional regulator
MGRQDVAEDPRSRKSSPSRRRPTGLRKGRRYHHGNLRHALIEAALALIGKGGTGSFTLREIGRRAGVSHGALYRHFATKDALLAELAAEGFRGLLASIQEAADEAGSDALARFKQTSIGYVRFALEHPAHFRVMFEPVDTLAGGAGLADALQMAFEYLLTLIRSCQTSGQIGEGDPNDIALCSWAMVHGVATLLVNGRLEIPSDKAVEELIFRLTDLLEQGLARPPAPKRKGGTGATPTLKIRGR